MGWRNNLGAMFCAERGCGCGDLLWRDEGAYRAGSSHLRAQTNLKVTNNCDDQHIQTFVEEVNL